MSADNGIYILETEGPEFRVAEMGAVDNYQWDNERSEYTDDPDVHIENAREMWGGCEVLTNEEDAIDMALKIDKEWGIGTEYGICVIKIRRRF
jgi:hypothetical protein